MEWEPVSERLRWVRLTVKCQNITIIQCYASTNDTGEDVKKTTTCLGQHPQKRHQNNMGDMNAKIGKETERKL